jgi:DNA-binding NarL/FixJ family response regulator
MRTAIDRSECWVSKAPEYETTRLSAVVADGTPTYLETVCQVLDLHDRVDLIGRAANFDETIQLVVNLRPDLVLMDIEMPSAMLVIAAVTIVGADVQIVGMSFAGCIPLAAPGLILSVNALIHKGRLSNELLPLLQTMHRSRAAFNPPLGLPESLPLSIGAR